VGALTLTYNRLRAVAARAVGLDLAAVSGDDLDELNSAPNEAVEEVSQARRWPRLVKTLQLTTQAPFTTGTITVTSGLTTVTLNSGSWPTWAAGAELYTANAAYLVASRDTPTQLTLATAYTGTSTSTGTFTLSQPWVWLPADFAELLRETDLTYGPTFNYGPLVPTDLAAIRLCRSAGWSIGPPLRYALGASDDSGGTYDGRLRLELDPRPDTTYQFLAEYRRSVRGMAAGGDLPDVPTELYKAVMLATRKCAKESFDLAVPRDLLEEYERAVSKAWQTLGLPLPNAAGAPAQRLSWGRESVQRGEWRALDSTYTTTAFNP
jgi:hypothetical protein